MNTRNALWTGCLLALTAAVAHTAEAGAADTETTSRINTTVAYLESADKALAANQTRTAQESLHSARRSAKDIVGGSFEVRAQQGAKAILSVRRLIREGDRAGADTLLKETEQHFKALLTPDGAGPEADAVSIDLQGSALRAE